MTLFDAARGAEGAAARGGEGAATERPRARVKLVVAYDGTDFHGFAAQPGQRTVGGALTEAAAKILGHEVDLTCAGRTDAGVHAWGQVASFDARPDVDLRRLQNGLNGILGPEVVVRECDVVAPSFDARHSATWRRYRYTIVNRPVPDPFRDRFTWWLPEPLDLRALRLAADPFMGEHDFASFCRKREGATTVRRVIESRWHADDDGTLVYEITANAFCWQMVRSIVGLLVDVGIGRRRPGDVMGIVRAGDRNASSNIAPPRGLSLWEVGYD